MNFDHITPEYIRTKAKEYNKNLKTLASDLSVSQPTLSKWLHETRNPSFAAKAAFHYYFEVLRLINSK